MEWRLSSSTRSDTCVRACGSWNTGTEPSDWTAELPRSDPPWLATARTPTKSGVEVTAPGAAEMVVRTVPSPAGCLISKNFAALAARVLSTGAAEMYAYVRRLLEEGWTPVLTTACDGRGVRVAGAAAGVPATAGAAAVPAEGWATAGCAVAAPGAAPAGGAATVGGGASAGEPPVTGGASAMPLGGPSLARFSFACSSSISRIAFSTAERLLAVASF